LRQCRVSDFDNPDKICHQHWHTEDSTVNATVFEVLNLVDIKIVCISTIFSISSGRSPSFWNYSHKRHRTFYTKCPCACTLTFNQLQAWAQQNFFQDEKFSAFQELFQDT